MSNTLNLTDLTFKQEVLDSDRPVLVDFWAPWCGPCRVVGPTIIELAKEYAGQVKVGKLNVDENPQSAARFGIRSIPTVLVFQQGTVVETLVGAQSRQRYDAALRRAAA